MSFAPTYRAVAEHLWAWNGVTHLFKDQCSDPTLASFEDGVTALHRRLAKPNVFRVAKRCRFEPSHTQVLAHFIRTDKGFRETLIPSMAGERPLWVRAEYPLGGPIADIAIQTDAGRLIIENKIDSAERSDQLSRIVRASDPSTTRYFFLTPDGVSPTSSEDPPTWEPMSYTKVLNAIRQMSAPNEFSTAYDEFIETEIVPDAITVALFERHSDAVKNWIGYYDQETERILEKLPSSIRGSIWELGPFKPGEGGYRPIRFTGIPEGWDCWVRPFDDTIYLGIERKGSGRGNLAAQFPDFIDASKHVRLPICQVDEGGKPLPERFASALTTALLSRISRRMHEHDRFA